MSREQEVFILADQTLLQVVQQIRDDQWGLSAESIPRMGDSVPTLREIINRHAYDDAWVPDVLAGRTIAEVGTVYDGDLLRGDPKANFSKFTNAAITAVRDLPADTLDKTVHLSYGDFPVREYLKHITTFRGFRAYTVAEFIGVNSTLPAELVQGLWEEVVPELEQWRALGIFGPPVEVSADADPQTRLLGLTGFLKR